MERNGCNRNCCPSPLQTIASSAGQLSESSAAYFSWRTSTLMHGSAEGRANYFGNLQKGVLSGHLGRWPKGKHATTLLDLMIIRAFHSKILRRFSLGTAIGFRIRKGTLTDTPAILVFVSRKVHRQWLLPTQCLPSALEGPGGVWCDVDVVEFSYYGAPAPTPKEQLYDELIDGLRGGDHTVGSGSQVASLETYGTLGAIVKSRTGNKQVGFLTNRHVAVDLHYPNQKMFHPLPPNLGPGVYLGAVERETSLITDDVWYGIYAGTNPETFVRADGAFIPFADDFDITSVSTSVKGVGVIGDVKAIDLQSTVGSLIGRQVVKVGRSSGLTTGTVIAYALEYNDEKRICFFTDFLVVGENQQIFDLEGDSGSLIILTGQAGEKPQPIGIIWGGTANRGRLKLKCGQGSENWTSGVDLGRLLDLLELDLITTSEGLQAALEEQRITLAAAANSTATESPPVPGPQKNDKVDKIYLPLGINIQQLPRDGSATSKDQPSENVEERQFIPNLISMSPMRDDIFIGLHLGEREQKRLRSDSDMDFLDEIIQVEKPHFNFCKDVRVWITIRKQYEGGHTCMPQVDRKLNGRNHMEQMIMEKILLVRNGGSNCSVICLNAESGHGKTTLLHALYNNQQLMDTFDKRIWIQLSDKLDMVMLFRKIVEVTMSDHCSIANLECLQEMVKEEIADKKFLLFLDDADLEDQQFWVTALEVLNAGAKGRAVIMTTRNTFSAFRDVATDSYFLNPLSEENNLMLLQQCAVVGTDIQSNSDLLMVAKRIISRFGSNPLNLKAIGGLLCHADSIPIELDKFEGSVMPLQLCHDVLPIHLKKCLAFCSLFPQGYIFDKHHMVLQWIAHGCVRCAEGCRHEDIGVEYFNELLCRCFFQYSPVHNDRFVMHELMYKVVASASRDKYFKSEDPTNSIPENILHLSLVSSQFQTIELMLKTEELRDLQTFLVMQPEWQPYKFSFPTLKLVGLDNFFLKFTSLEILDLSHTDTEVLPGSIGGLRNLQYLSVNNTNIRSLPSELCSLSNLETLESKDCRFLTELPGDATKLLKLRHLDVTKELDYVHLPHGIGHLTELRTLPVFHASRDPSHCSVSELGNLHNLRGCLQLSGLESVKTGSKAQEANLKDKHHLKDLTLQWHDGGVDIDDEDEDTENVAEQVLESLQPHTNLEELAIRGYEGSVFPAWMQSSSSLPNLVSLTLDGCCNCTEFPVIAHLPSLKFLSVRKMYCVQRLITNNIVHGTTKFPSLELVNLWEMYGLEELFEASEGDCPRLHKVCVSRCPDLKRLPCVPSVRELVLHCGRELPDIPELVSLASLKIEGFHGVKSFSLPALPALKKMEIRSCKELLSVEGLSALTTVQRLKVAGCPKLVLPRTDSLTS